MWEKGQSGNPAGRAKKGETLTDILRELGGVEDAGPDGKTARRRALADTLWRKALEGDYKAAEYIIDRMDGKPKERIDQEGETVVRIVFDDGTQALAETTGVLGEPGEV